ASRALKMDVNCPHAKNHMALAKLEMGEWEEGWDYWENRWEVPERLRMKRDYKCPKWDGSPLDGTLVIHGEQGLGDEILYMSCFNEVKAERIIIESATRLVSLFKRSFNVPVYGTAEEVMRHEKPDRWISMGSLPALFRKTDESFERQPERFLVPDSKRVEHWKSKLGENPIGIAWYGGVAKTHSKLRNAPLDLWKDLTSTNHNFISIQYETGDTVKEAEALGVPHFQEAVEDFDDLTSLIEACDSIITVCQTAHHTAGGLGKPCWTLVPPAAAWRYGLKGEKNVWYPSVRQFRGDWETIFSKVKHELDIGRVSTAERSAA
ncbi:hypothetical protein LCGC14_2368560, partial [marine sediment metagenome]